MGHPWWWELVFAAAGLVGVVCAVGGAGDVEGVLVLEFADRGAAVDGDAAGAGGGAQGGASSVDRAGHVVVVDRALHGERLIDVDLARAGGCVEVDAGVGGYFEVNASGAALEAPVGGGAAGGVDGAGAALGVEAAGEAVDADGS